MLERGEKLQCQYHEWNHEHPSPQNKPPAQLPVRQAKTVVADLVPYPELHNKNWQQQQRNCTCQKRVVVGEDFSERMLDKVSTKIPPKNRPLGIIPMQR